MPEPKMKALSIHQPWASLIAVEAKRIETRHWPAHTAAVGQRIAIHASKNKRSLDIGGAGRFREVLAAAHAAGTLYLDDDGSLPLGLILATAVLKRCEPMGDDFAKKYSRDELIFGNFAPTRWAWVLTDVERLAEPIPYRGQQGVFDLDAETTRRLYGSKAEA